MLSTQVFVKPGTGISVSYLMVYCTELTENSHIPLQHTKEVYLPKTHLYMFTIINFAFRKYSKEKHTWLKFNIQVMYNSIAHCMSCEQCLTKQSQVTTKDKGGTYMFLVGI